MMRFGYTYLSKRHCYSIFNKILVVVQSRILQDGIVQNFKNNILVVHDDTDIMFASVACKGAVVIIFPEFLGK